MSVRPILFYAKDKAALRRKSKPIGTRGPETRQLIMDLKDTLLQHGNGIGLAAPQIGVHKRAIVVCLGAGDGKKAGPPIGIVDPVILEAGCELPDFDGCLSIPGFYAQTVRPHFMRLRGQNERGVTCEWTLKGFDAVVVHHEVDHLNGILFIDRVASPDALVPTEKLGDKATS
jgi:peptide deformylase